MAKKKSYKAESVQEFIEEVATEEIVEEIAVVEEIVEEIAVVEAVVLKPSKPLSQAAASVVVTNYLKSSNLLRKLSVSDVLANVPLAYTINDYIPFIEKHTK